MALIGKDDDAAIARTDMAFAEGGVQIGFHNVLAELHQIALINITIGGIVDMQRGAPVLQDEFHGDVQTFLIGRNARVFSDDEVAFLLGDGLDQIRNILKMIIEGVAVDAALLDDVLDGDFVQRLFVEQRDKGHHDGLARERRHCSFTPYPGMIIPQNVCGYRHILCALPKA